MKIQISSLETWTHGNTPKKKYLVRVIIGGIFFDHEAIGPDSAARIALRTAKELGIGVEDNA